MRQIYFNNREGQTVLSSLEKKGLLLDHIVSINELNEAEQLNIQDAFLELLQNPPKVILDEKYFRKLHKMLFGQVWKWAGVYRSSEKNIGVDAWRVPSETVKLIKDAEFWLENKTYPREQFLAHFHHRLVSIHPFPNGNGRFSRIVTNLLCRKVGWKEPTWKPEYAPEERRKIYIDALREADMRRYESLYKYFS